MEVYKIYIHVERRERDYNSSLANSILNYKQWPAFQDTATEDPVFIMIIFNVHKMQITRRSDRSNY